MLVCCPGRSSPDESERPARSVAIPPELADTQQTPDQWVSRQVAVVANIKESASSESTVTPSFSIATQDPTGGGPPASVSVTSTGRGGTVWLRWGGSLRLFWPGPPTFRDERQVKRRWPSRL